MRVVILIVALAFLLRIFGIDYGLPMFLVGDEVSITAGALKMLELRTLIPTLHPEEFRLLYYPPVIPYLYLFGIVPVLAWKLVVFGNAAAVAGAVAIDPSSVWLASRFITAALGVATVYLVYLSALKIFNKSSAVTASLLVSVSFLHVQLSHFARHWVPAGFFAGLIAYLGLRLIQNRDWRAYLLAGAAAGVGFGASYITAIAFTIPVFIHFFGTPGPFFIRLRDRKFWLMTAVFFILAFVFALLNYPEFHRIVFGEDSGLVQGNAAEASIVQSAWSLFEREPSISILALAGIGLLWRSNRRLALLFAAYPVLYWVVLHFFFHFEPRYNVLIVSLLCLPAGVGLASLWDSRKLIARSAAIALAGFALAVSVYADYLLVRPDTRELARKYVHQHIPDGSGILLDSRTFDLLPTPDSAQRLMAEYPEAVRTRDRAIAARAHGGFDQRGYELINLSLLSEENRRQLLSSPLGQRYPYLIVEKDGREAEHGDAFRQYRLIAVFGEEANLDINGNFTGSVWRIFSARLAGPPMYVLEYVPTQVAGR